MILSETRRRRTGPSFINPRSFFTGGANGLWYDNDPATWFEDSAMTTLATFGNPIGAWRDKSGNGLHAVQSVAASRPTYGRQPFGGVRNAFIQTATVGGTAWTRTEITVASDGLTLETAATASHLANQQTTLIANNQNVCVSYRYKPSGRNNAVIGLRGNDVPGTLLKFYSVDVTTGVSVKVSENLAGGSISEEVITVRAIDASGYYTVEYTAKYNFSTAQPIRPFIGLHDGVSVSASYTGDITKGGYIIDSQLEMGTVRTNHQAVVQGYDVTESGVASVPCPWTDSVDDFLDFTTTGGATLARDVGRLIVCGTANMTAAISTFRAMMRLSTAGANTNPRAMLGGSATGNLSAQGRRLDADATETVSVAQNTFTNIVATADFNYSAAELYLRRNGAVVASDLTFQTAGNTEDTDSFACYIGRNVTNYYGGFIPSLFAIADTALSDAQKLQLETYMAQQIGVTGL